MSGIDRGREVFREEAIELLAELESSLLELEGSPSDMETVGRVFRALHTIKGSGAMFGFEDLSKFTHELETLFDMVRNGVLHVTREIMDAAFASLDVIKALLDAACEGRRLEGGWVEDMILTLKSILPEKADAGEKDPKDKAVPERTFPEHGASVYRIRFTPGANIFKRGVNPVLLFEELKCLGDCTIIAHSGKVSDLRELNPEDCHLYWDVVLTSDAGLDAIKDVFIFVEADGEVRISVVADSISIGDEGCKLLGEILVERGDLSPEELKKVLGSKKRIGQMLVDEGLIRRSYVESALKEQEAVKNKLAEKETSSIRVPSSRLDRLVNLVGELVTVQARLSRHASNGSDPELVSIAEEVERLSDELRDNTMSIRMVPIGTTFSKFKRLVRDLSAELGKEVELVAEGAETELDKTVIEKLNDPLVHLIRNSIDHGIEAPEARTASGKPRRGTVRLSAEHSGPYVLVRISDDGAGMDIGEIRRTAAEKGLIDDDASISENDVVQLVFTPGFSTSQGITSVSGRGVGLDVVKKGVESLRGTIEIKNITGEGMVITLKIPLTLVIIEGLLIKVSGEFFVVPLSIVEECVELTRKDAGRFHGRKLADVRGEVVPYIKLREQFGIGGASPEIEQIVITRVDGNRVGFVVDNVIGEYQTVIKTLGRFYRDIEGISGATILGDGRVALILDIEKLSKSAEETEKQKI